MYKKQDFAKTHIKREGLDNLLACLERISLLLR